MIAPDIEIENLTKKFNQHVIFKNFTHKFHHGSKCAFIGANGSGKSTMLLSIAGFMQPTAGKVLFKQNNNILSEDNKHAFISFAAPYIELNESLTGLENVAFQMELKPSFFRHPDELFKKIELTKAAHLAVKFYSSGMKQLLKLALAISSDVPILFLDEPCSNLDDKNTQIFLQLMNEFATNKTVILGTNSHQTELSLVNESFAIENYK